MHTRGFFIYTWRHTDILWQIPFLSHYPPDKNKKTTYLVSDAERKDHNSVLLSLVRPLPVPIPAGAYVPIPTTQNNSPLGSMPWAWYRLTTILHGLNSTCILAGRGLLKDGKAVGCWATKPIGDPILEWLLLYFTIEAQDGGTFTCIMTVSIYYFLIDKLELCVIRSHAYLFSTG